MGSKTKTVGGGNAVAQSANNGYTNFLANGFSQGAYNGAMGGPINNMLQGRIGDPTSLSQYFQQGGDGGFQPNQMPMNYDQSNGGMQGVNTNYNGPGAYNTPSYSFGQMGMPQGVGMAQNLPHAQSQYNPGALNGIQLGNTNGTSIGNTDLASGLGGRAQLGDAGSANVAGGYEQAVQQVLSREQEKQVADLRARYGTGGSSNLGSAAAYAEGNFRAENTPRIASALGQINESERGLNLQQRGQDLQNYLGSRNADVQQMGNLGQRQLSMLGMNNQALLGQNDQTLQSAQFGASQGLQAQGMNINAMLQNQQMGNQSAADFRGLDQNALNQYNQYQAQNAQFGAGYNQQNAQFGANFGQQGQQFNNQLAQQNNQFGANFGQQGQMYNNQFGLQNQQQMNQYGLGMGNLGANLQGQQLQAQQAALQQLFGSYMQNQGYNTARPEVIQQPGFMQQAMGLAGQAAGIYGAIRGARPLGNLMTGGNTGGGGPTSYTPQALPQYAPPQNMWQFNPYMVP